MRWRRLAFAALLFDGMGGGEFAVAVRFGARRAAI
jgi:hypothetical protein